MSREWTVRAQLTINQNPSEDGGHPHGASIEDRGDPCCHGPRFNCGSTSGGKGSQVKEAPLTIVYEFTTAADATTERDGGARPPTGGRGGGVGNLVLKKSESVRSSSSGRI